MRYLIIITDKKNGNRSAFYTKWYGYESNYNSDFNMIVVDREQNKITFDGKTWQNIEFDYL